MKEPSSILADLAKFEKVARAYGVSESTIVAFGVGIARASSTDGGHVANFERILLELADIHAPERDLAGHQRRQWDTCLLCVYLGLGLAASVASMRKRLACEVERLSRLNGKG